jgi:DNA-binding NarL/FixJ family response regulator
LEAGGVNVLVVDDQEPFRSAARAVLRAMAGFAIVGEAASGEEAVELAATLQPDLVLMDVMMAGIGGIEAARRIASARPGTVIVLLSSYREEDLPSNARACGAAAYLHKADFGATVLQEVWRGVRSRARPGRGVRPSRGGGCRAPR